MVWKSRSWFAEFPFFLIKWPKDGPGDQNPSRMILRSFFEQLVHFRDEGILPAEVSRALDDPAVCFVPKAENCFFHGHICHSVGFWKYWVHWRRKRTLTLDMHPAYPFHQLHSLSHLNIGKVETWQRDLDHEEFRWPFQTKCWSVFNSNSGFPANIYLSSTHFRSFTQGYKTCPVPWEPRDAGRTGADCEVLRWCLSTIQTEFMANQDVYIYIL